jgi:methylenetetrahydrofolate reductase (NADPH)
MKPLKTESSLEKLFNQGELVVTSELGPPKSASYTELREHAAHLKDYADGFNLTDNQTSIVRLSSIAAGVHVLAGGAHPIIQMTCRDRNRIAMQSDLLGAYSLGIRNVLCLSGDHQSFGNHPTCKNVYDLDSVQLIGMVKKMRDEKQFLCGEAIKVEPRFYIGAVENPFGDPFEFRVARLAKKVAAGADFIQTQAIFDVEKFARFMELVRAAGIHERVNITAGVLPVKSLKALQYMKNDVAGMEIPDALIDRMSKAENKQEEGINICVDIMKQCLKIEGVKGIHIMPVAWESALPALVERAGLLPRPSRELITNDSRNAPHVG